MNEKFRIIVSAFLLGTLGMPFNAHAEKNPFEQYEKFLEPEDKVIITEKEEKITYSRNSSGVSASLETKTKYMNRYYGEDSDFQIYYNEEDTKLKNIKETKATHTLSSNLDNDEIFFDGLNVCKGRTDLREIGDKASFQYELEFNNAIHLARIVFAEKEFIGKHTVSIEVPAWLDLDIKEFNFNGKVNKDVNKSDKKTTYTFTMENVKPLKDEKFAEPALYVFPSILFVYRSATLSNGNKLTLFNTAQDQYDWYNSLMKQTVENNDFLCSETKKIVTKCKNDYEKIATLYQWVQKNIRYIAFENGIAGFKPQLASKVLDDKYGDCKGMANLLRNMLRCEGIDGRMVWLGTSDLPYNYSTPSLAVDNHAICAAIIGKDTIFLDATCEYAAMKEYPKSIAGRPVMLENGEDCILTKVPDNRPHDNLDSTYVSMKVTNNGLEGIYKNIQRGEDKIKFLYHFDDDYTDILASLRSSSFKGLPAEEEQVKITGTSSSDKEVVVEYPFTMSAPITQANGKYYISMDFTHRFMSLDIETANRKTNLYLRYRAVDAFTSELTIPDGYKVSYLPANLTIDKKRYKFEVKYKQKGGKITYTRSVTLKDHTIPTKELDEWNKDIEKLKSAYMEMVTLQK